VSRTEPRRTAGRQPRFVRISRRRPQGLVDSGAWTTGSRVPPGRCVGGDAPRSIAVARRRGRCTQPVESPIVSHPLPACRKNVAGANRRISAQDSTACRHSAFLVWASHTDAIDHRCALKRPPRATIRDKGDRDGVVTRDATDARRPVNAPRPGVRGYTGRHRTPQKRFASTNPEAGSARGSITP
jgi:hypothetical protein